jgi:hypothetical protein
MTAKDEQRQRQLQLQLQLQQQLQLQLQQPIQRSFAALRMRPLPFGVVVAHISESRCGAPGSGLRMTTKDEQRQQQLQQQQQQQMQLQGQQQRPIRGSFAALRMTAKYGQRQEQLQQQRQRQLQLPIQRSFAALRMRPVAFWGGGSPHLRSEMWGTRRRGSSEGEWATYWISAMHLILAIIRLRRCIRFLRGRLWGGGRLLRWSGREGWRRRGRRPGRRGRSWRQSRPCF